MGVGDVNGDGIADSVQFMYDLGDVLGISNYGAAVVVFGKHDGSVVDLSAAIAGNGGFLISHVDNFYDTSTVVGAAGDFNGDGFDDIVVAHNFFDTIAFGGGAAVVVFGKADGNPVNAEAIALGGSGGFAIYGEANGAYVGQSVSGAGDVNGDGFADIVVGSNASPFAPTYYGTTAVVFGGPITGAFPISEVGDATDGFLITTSDYDSLIGDDVGGAGDVNGDGLDDLLVSCLTGYAGPNEVHVVFGKADDALVDLTTISAGGGGGFAVVESVPGDDFGGRVAGGGDVNGDGLADVLVTASESDRGGAGPNFDITWVVFGQSGVTPVQASDIEAGTSGGFVVINDQVNYDVDLARGVGDMNGDGLSDIILGGALFGPPPFPPGQAQIVWGKTSYDSVNFSDIAAETHGFQINGSYSAGNAFAGYACGGAGDVSGDGLADVIVGGPPSYGYGGGVWIVNSPNIAPLSSQYIVMNQAGPTPLRPVGMVGDRTQYPPDGRMWVGFDTGSGPGVDSSSLTYGTIVRSDFNITNLGDGSLNDVADVQWFLSTNRTGWANASVLFHYVDSDLGTLSENGMTLFRSTAGPNGPWTAVSATFDADNNTIQATVAEDGPTVGYFALLADLTPPTATISLITSEEEQDYAVFTVDFDEPVAPTFDVSDLTITSGDNIAIPFMVNSDPNYSVVLVFNNIDGNDDVSFEITGSVSDAGGNLLTLPVSSPTFDVNNYPVGDINHDGAFDIADVALLADINLSIATFP